MYLVGQDISHHNTNVDVNAGDFTIIKATEGEGYTDMYNTIESCKKNCYFIGYVGDGIEFTTPPPKDAVITMDAYTDLPFVSPNNVLDLSATLTFHF